MPERLIIERVRRALRGVLPPSIDDELVYRYGEELALILRSQIVRVDNGQESVEIEVPANWRASIVDALVPPRLLRWLGVAPTTRTIRVVVDWDRFLVPKDGHMIETHDVKKIIEQ